MKTILDKTIQAAKKFVKITSPRELEPFDNMESETYLSLSPESQTFSDLIYAQEIYFKKLSKTISETEIIALEAKIEVLLEIKNKLCEY